MVMLTVLTEVVNCHHSSAKWIILGLEGIQISDTASFT